MKEKISIALATYNGAKYLSQQIYSLMAQTILPIEIVIVDDNSSDDTVKLLYKLQEEFPRIKLFLNEENQGPIKSFKRAIFHCTSEYIALCDQDDIWEPEKLHLCFDALRTVEKQSVPSIAFSDLKVVDSDGNLISESFWGIQGYQVEKITFKNILFGNVVTGCTIMMNLAMKRALEKMPDDVAMHDHWIALIAYGFGRIKYIRDTPIKYRVHERSVTNKSKPSLISRFKLLINNILDRKGQYMRENIIQADRFKDCFYQYLTDDNRRSLDNFVSLQSRGSLFRKLYIGLQKYYYGK